MCGKDDIVQGASWLRPFVVPCAIGRKANEHRLMNVMGVGLLSEIAHTFRKSNPQTAAAYSMMPLDIHARTQRLVFWMVRYAVRFHLSTSSSTIATHMGLVLVSTLKSSMPRWELNDTLPLVLLNERMKN